jgi:nucleoid DNA-binding protein
MRKSDLIELISKQTGIIQSDVELVVAHAFRNIREKVKEGKEVRIKEFGVFKTRRRRQKIGRNLGGKVKGKRKNPDPILIPECTVPHFKPSKQFLKAA